MIYEKTELRFDISKLVQHLESEVLPHEPMRQSSAFGGWSVLSSDGTYKDGWQRGYQGMRDNMSLEELAANRDKLGARPLNEYVVPTEICNGYLMSVIDEIQKAKLFPRRARIIALTPGSESVWHRDAPENIYSVRLHIPIITNENCFFETETERAHLSADGSAYLLYVNRLHRVVNYGSTVRYHLVMDVRDQDKISTHHRLEDFHALHGNPHSKSTSPQTEAKG